MRVFLSVILLFFALPCFSEDLKLQTLFLTDTSDIEEISDDYVLKGYAEYLENSEAVVLTDDNDEFIVNLKVPQKITSKRLIDKNTKSLAKKPVKYSKFGSEEYIVTPQSGNMYLENGNFAFGTLFEQIVDTGELEQASGLFTRYRYGRFTINSAYKRTIGSTYNNYMDKVYFAPEYMLNNTVSIKEVISADITKNRRSAEFVLSLKPLQEQNKDRLNIEFGAGQTYDSSNSVIKNQVRFSTRFKL